MLWVIAILAVLAVIQWVRLRLDSMQPIPRLKEFWYWLFLLTLVVLICAVGWYGYTWLMWWLA